jgi:hypothetical protein
MDSVTRTKALAAGAAGLLLVLAIVGTGAPETASTPSGPGGGAAPPRSATVVLAGAPRDLDAAGLKQRYAAINSAEPFKARSFEPPARASVAPVTTRENGPVPVARKVDPLKLELRFTGLLGQGAARAAILEETDGSGRGVVALPGLKLGPVEIAVVGSASISIVDSGTRKDVDLGEAIVFPIAVRSSVTALKPPNPDGTVPVRAGASNDGTVAPAPISAEERNATLERLRERRRRDLKPQPQPEPEPQPLEAPQLQDPDQDGGD